MICPTWSSATPRTKTSLARADALIEQRRGGLNKLKPRTARAGGPEVAAGRARPDQRSGVAHRAGVSGGRALHPWAPRGRDGARLARERRCSALATGNARSAMEAPAAHDRAVGRKPGAAGTRCRAARYSRETGVALDEAARMIRSGQRNAPRRRRVRRARPPPALLLDRSLPSSARLRRRPGCV